MNQTALGELGGVGKRAQINYEQNLRQPDSGYLARIEKFGIDVLYMLTGRHGDAATSAPVVSQAEPVLSDRARLEAAISAVEEGLAETRRKLPPAKRAELILAAYDLMAQPKQTRANVIRLVRTAA